ADLADRVRATLGLDYRVLSGEEEAAMTFRGTLAMVPGLDAACVLDIGGGSTEIVVGEASAPPHYRISLDVGSVRLTERFFRNQPPTAVQIAAAERTLDAVLGMVPREPITEVPLVEGGGTARVLAALIGATAPVPTIPYATVRAWRDQLLALTPTEVRALHPSLLTGREDVTAAAVLLLDTVMQRFGFDAFIASAGGLRHGLALDAAEAS
ncbi:MAG: exopolyphosphatase, partial [Rhodothermaceae bacterium]|nr:exopolyphosphatase [Rhodothermaceae bacterium]